MGFLGINLPSIFFLVIFAITSKKIRTNKDNCKINSRGEWF